jgi:hypothetical protein
MRVILKTDTEAKGFIQMNEIADALRKMYPGRISEDGFQGVNIERILNMF